MTLTNGYADLPTLRDRFSIEDPFDDATLELVLGAVARRIDQHCQRIFYDAAASASARVYYPDAAGLIRVHDFHTVTGLVVKTDDNDDGTFETTWTISTDFQVEPLNGIVNGQPGWPYNQIRSIGTRAFPNTKRPGVQVTARWGFATVPEPVREACLIQAARMFKRKDSPFGVAGSAEFGVMRLLNKLDPDVEFMLAPYVKSPVFCA